MARTPLAVLVVALLLAAAPAATAGPGDLDRRFGNSGTAYTALLDGGWKGLVQRDGRIVVAGGIYRPGLLRLTPGGRRDRSFGEDGIASGERSELLPFDLRREPGGGFRVAAGTVTTYSPPVELLRWTAGGRAASPLLHETPFLGPLGPGTLRPDGGAFVWSRQEIRAVAPDGTVDTSFGGGTVHRRDVGLGSFYGDVAVRGDGRLLISGTRERRPVILQLTPDGRPDPAFGDGGIAQAPFVGGPLAVLRNGDVLGAASGRGPRLARIFRLTPDGRRRFTRALPWRARGGGWIADVAEGRRGRLYVLGNVVRRRRPFVVATTRRGAPRPRFGRRGRALLPRPPRGFIHANEGNDLLLDRRGGLLVVGLHYRDGVGHPVFGCGCREDFSAGTVRVAVWRLRA
ncbi:MAG TPA: hypothetical protein VHF89_18120 [Solirubrobacteraceae bacterium]|nr:hypothetical protein [Solirubrobacteraceae bacterium]